MTEDEHKKCLDDIQKCLKEYEEKVTGVLDKKTAEVMEN
jgi:ribosome recycling factor